MLKNGRFTPCPDSPNCVSSQAEDPEHFIEPLRYGGDVREARARLLAILRAMQRVSIVTEEPHYIHAECTSAWLRFVDDAEFLFDEPRKVIHVRSASRVGYYDFGVNRGRIEQIRTEWSKE